MDGGLASWFRSRAEQSKLTWAFALEVAVMGVAVWAHVHALASMPQGIYKDEASIAYNAHLIATTGHDEFGESFPLYPKSFGDYKNAGYVWLSVLVMRVVDLSEWSVRLPSVLCWLAGSAFLYWLGRPLWTRTESRLFLLLQLAFTPSLLCLSRMAFEVIGVYPALALFLLGVHRGFERGSARWAAIAGVAIGASTYMYSTFRLLAPLHCLLILLCYGTRQHIRSLLSFAASAFVSVIPFAWYMVAHGHNLTSRYRLVGYAHRSMSLTEKLEMFVTRYVEYFSPQYLLLHGDTKLRHHTGYGGELLAPTVLALLLGIALIVFVPRFPRTRFHGVLLGGLLLSPVSASLTLDHYHSLRAFSLVVFAILIALCGFDYALPKVSRYAPALVVVATLLCAGAFVKDYFGPYRAKTIPTFEYYGIREAILKAVHAHATRVVIDSGQVSRHAELYASFYQEVLAKRQSSTLPQFQPGLASAVLPGEYFVFQDAKHAHNELRQGLPADALYVAAPYGPITKQPAKRSKKRP